MPRYYTTFVIALCILLTACKPEAVIEKPTQQQAIELFETRHRSKYDPNSRVDREKLQVLLAELEGKPTPVAEVKPTAPPKTTNVRDKLLEIASSLVGTTEKTGKNDGPVIEAILASVGLKKGDPYCAAFNYYVYDRAGIAAKVPRTGWSPSWVASPTWKDNKGITPKKGDAFGIYFTSVKRVAHTGLIETWGDDMAITVEGNTSPSAEFGGASDRDGDGVWRKRRVKRQIYSVRNWID